MRDSRQTFIETGNEILTCVQDTQKAMYKNMYMEWLRQLDPNNPELVKYLEELKAKCGEEM